jgi:uncharacterized protein with PIN domain
MVIEALREERAIITRNSRISRFPGPRILRITSDFVEEQIRQTIKAFKLKVRTDKMFTRCVICNIELRKVNKPKIKKRVPEYVYETQEDFLECAQCKRVYWQGTHWGNVKKYLGNIGLKCS